MKEMESWKPTASISNLSKRAEILNKIRRFFLDRSILEVETPSMSQATITDIHLCPFKTCFLGPGITDGLTLYMTTSPEYHMKRLLAYGSGSIYQIGRSFRNEEVGRYHNPEFTILEWYRLNYEMFRLIDEVKELLKLVLDCVNVDMLSYQDVFQDYLNIDPLLAEIIQLREVASKSDLSSLAHDIEDRGTLLQLLFTFKIQPHIGQDQPIVIYHFPASQAGLSEISTKDNRVAKRFEVYFKGIELANGCRELINRNEQFQRFEQENCNRARLRLPMNPIDKNLLDALQYGVPACAGVALGIDRLVMLALGKNNLSDVIAFPVGRA